MKVAKKLARRSKSVDVIIRDVPLPSKIAAFFPEAAHTSRTTRIIFLLLAVAVIAFVVVQFTRLTRQYLRHEPKTFVSMTKGVPFDMTVLTPPLWPMHFNGDGLLPDDIEYIRIPKYEMSNDSQSTVQRGFSNVTDAQTINTLLIDFAMLRIIGDFDAPLLGRINRITDEPFGREDYRTYQFKSKDFNDPADTFELLQWIVKISEVGKEKHPYFRATSKYLEDLDDAMSGFPEFIFQHTIDFGGKTWDQLQSQFEGLPLRIAERSSHVYYTHDQFTTDVEVMECDKPWNRTNYQIMNSLLVGQAYHWIDASNMLTGGGLSCEIYFQPAVSTFVGNYARFDDPRIPVKRVVLGSKSKLTDIFFTESTLIVEPGYNYEINLLAKRYKILHGRYCNEEMTRAKLSPETACFAERYYRTFGCMPVFAENYSVEQHQQTCSYRAMTKLEEERVAQTTIPVFHKADLRCSAEEISNTRFLPCDSTAFQYTIVQKHEASFMYSSNLQFHKMDENIITIEMDEDYSVTKYLADIGGLFGLGTFITGGTRIVHMIWSKLKTGYKANQEQKRKHAAEMERQAQKMEQQASEMAELRNQLKELKTRTCIKIE